MDEMVPIIDNAKTGKKFVFGQSPNNSLWVALLEKAWAKLYGNYLNIEAGSPEEPLHDLTGAPVKVFDLRSKKLCLESFWKTLLKASENVWPMVAGSKKFDNKRSSKGIISGHAYTFIQALQIDIDGKREKVVQLRNPWARKSKQFTEYSGKWCLTDPIWNKVKPVIKSELGML